jgi:hypothetical protein
MSSTKTQSNNSGRGAEEAPLLSEVQEFIQRRFPTDSNWCDGNCYYFALILCDRFPSLCIYYDPIPGHFIAGDGTVFFDWHGEYFPETEPYDMRELQNEDPIYIKRLIRDCKF